MGKSKKIIFNLTIDDLRELGIIGKKRRKGRKGRNKKRILLIDPQTGAIIGEPKSDSSHMIGSTQSIQPSNTNNVSTAIQQANLEAIENANKRAKDQRQWLIDNGIDPNDPTIGLQSQERFPDRNTTKLLEGFGANVSDQLGQMKSQYDNQLLGYQDRFANYDKTINRGMEFVQQQANQIEELKKKPFTYRLDDSAGAFGATKGSDSFKSNNTSKSMNEINNTPASPGLRMQTPTRFTPDKEPTPAPSPLIQVADNKIPLKSNDEVYVNEAMKHDNDVDYSAPQETLDERLDREYKEVQNPLSNLSSPDSSLSSIGEVAIRKVDNSGKQIDGMQVPNYGRKSISNAKNLKIIEEVRKENELKNLRAIANNLIKENADIIPSKSIDNFIKKANKGQTPTVEELIEKIQTMRKKHDAKIEASNKAKEAVNKRLNFFKTRIKTK
jgi:hypothetical protein